MLRSASNGNGIAWNRPLAQLYTAWGQIEVWRASRRLRTSKWREGRGWNARGGGELVRARLTVGHGKLYGRRTAAVKVVV